MSYSIEEKNEVTVGEIRDHLNASLYSQFNELKRLIMENGYHKQHVAQEYLEKQIGNTLCLLDNIDVFARNVLLQKKYLNE